MRKLILIFALNLIISVCKSQEPFAKCLYENDPSLLRQSTNNELFESLKVMSVELEGNRGSRHLDISRLAGGVYPYTVRCGDKTKTGKIVITR